MNKKELAAKAADLLREQDIRKPVKIKKHVFTVSDADGNCANFAVKRGDKMVLYSVDDVVNIIDACLEITRRAIQDGEEIAIKGFGTLGVQKRAARATKRPDTGEWCTVPERYVPKFYFGNELRVAARVFELSIPEREMAEKLHSLEGEQDVSQTQEER
jgi:nucleoid DNA-binding protein